MVFIGVNADDSQDLELTAVHQAFDGHLLAPEKPGLGLTLRRDFVRSITV